MGKKLVQILPTAAYKLLHVNSGDCNEQPLDRHSCEMNCMYGEVARKCQCRLSAIHEQFTTARIQVDRVLDGYPECNLAGIQRCRKSLSCGNCVSWKDKWLKIISAQLSGGIPLEPLKACFRTCQPACEHTSYTVSVQSNDTKAMETDSSIIFMLMTFFNFKLCLNATGAFHLRVRV